jgi:NAD(P)-dependent dehydrogenase (short-subunit alcohol dehydrogenase family)
LPKNPYALVSVAGGFICGFLAMIRYVAQGGRNTHEKRLDGKVVIVTGANTGIGLPTAIKLASLGAHVVIACRQSNKTLCAVDEIKKKSGSDLVSFIPIELSSFTSVREFAKEFKSRFTSVDILINNAGVMACPYEKSEDGFERQIATNHLGHFLLTMLLIDYLKQSQGKIVNVSSNGHFLFPKENVTSNDILYPEESTYNPIIAYGNSKLANVLFSAEIQRRYGELGVKSYSLHPGAVRTELARSLPLVARYIVQGLALLYFKSPEEGAQTTLFCVLNENAVSGLFHSDCKVDTSTKEGMSAALASELWEQSAKIVGL